MIASPAYADWKWVSESVNGNTYYVDFDRIRTNGSNVYFWVLVEFSEPDKDGNLSFKTYSQGDCEMFRYKGLSASYHKQPTGKGSGTYQTRDNEWYYPPPNSAGEVKLRQVCWVSAIRFPVYP